MTYNKLLLLPFITTLGACSLLPLPQQGSSEQAIEKIASTETEAIPQELQESSVDSKQIVPNSATVVDDINLLAQGLISQSDLYLQSKRRLDPDTRKQVVDALALFYQGDFLASQKVITKVLLNSLQLTSSVYMLAGDIALANEEPKKAEKYYQLSYAKNQYNAKVANRLAKIMREKGEFVESERLYTQAIHAQPAHEQSYRNRAVLYDLYLQDKAKALADYETYSALLDHKLQQHESVMNLEQVIPIENAPTTDVTSVTLDETALNALNENMTLVKRWILDVGRQVAAQKRAAGVN